ncbi:MAG: type VI secretion system membrane subunit TssM, partial [Pseudomonadota bacterium]
LPDWRLTEIGGPAVSRVLVRSSGKALNEGIEGIFTYRGFNEVFMGEAIGVAKRVQRESWVLGPRGEAEQTDLALAALSRDVLDLYYNDFIARYDAMLGDVDIVPMESLSHAVEVTNVLSGPTSPMVNVLMAISDETRLTENRSALPSEVNEGFADVAGMELQSNTSVQTRILLEALAATATGQGGPPPAAPGQYVEDRFSWLHDLTERPENQPSQLDGLMGTLTEVYQELNKMSFSGVSGGETGAALQRFNQDAARIPGPMERWATQIINGSSGITSDSTRASINARWQSNVLPFCEQVVGDRYPFNRRARADVAMPDFAKLFGPTGLIDTFFNDTLAKHVDIRTRPWSWKTGVNQTDLGISPAVLQQMQYAAEIKEAFFANGPQPGISFQLMPEALDPKAKSVKLEIDGQVLDFSHKGGLPSPMAIAWPGAVGLARVSFHPDKRNIESVLSRDGPWAWFRLLDAAEVRRTNVSDRKKVIFNVGGRI